MELALGLLMITAVSALIAAPLVRTDGTSVDNGNPETRELWEREKYIALLAIKEADFDRATGKLSDDDYDNLRAGYEQRALAAIDKLGDPATTADGAVHEDDPSRPALFCPACGNAFQPIDKFCRSCGTNRTALG